MKKMIPLLLVGALSISLLSGCSSEVSASQNPMDIPDGMGGMLEEAVSVETTLVSQSAITNTLTYSGTVDYVKSWTVVPDVSGKVQAIYFDVGDYVNEGDVLFEIDDQDIQDNIQQLNASLASASATVQQQQTRLEQLDGSTKETTMMNLNTNISNAETSVENAKISLANSETSLAQAETNLNTAKLDYDNIQTLFDVGGTSQTELDNKKNAYETALSSYETAQRSVDQAKLSLQQAEETLENARTTYDITVNQTMGEDKKTQQEAVNSAVASRNSISVQIQQARQKLEKTKVKSPVSGIISQKNVEFGANVTTAATAFVIVDDSVVTVNVGVTEQLLESVSVGDQVTVTISSLRGESMAGTVTTISPVTDSSGTYPINVEIPNGAGKIKSGMFAEVTFNKDKNDNAIAITKDAVLTDENGSYVYTVSENKAVKVMVETGIDNGVEVEIVSGLNVGDEVIVKGQNQLSDGSTVQIIGAEEILAEPAADAGNPIDEIQDMEPVLDEALAGDILDGDILEAEGK